MARKKKKPQVPAKDIDKVLVLKAILELVSALLKFIRELLEWLDRQRLGVLGVTS